MDWKIGKSLRNEREWTWNRRKWDGIFEGIGIVGFRGIGMVGDRARKWLRYKVFLVFGEDRVGMGFYGSWVGFKWIWGDLRGDFCNMVLLQRGTTRLAGRVDAWKNENTPLPRKSAKRRGLHCVYYAVYVLYTLHSLFLAVGRRSICTAAAKT